MAADKRMHAVPTMRMWVTSIALHRFESVQRLREGEDRYGRRADYPVR
jgi:hypothetical protein